MNSVSDILSDYLNWQEANNGIVGERELVWLELKAALKSTFNKPSRIAFYTSPKCHGLNIMAGILLSGNICVPIDINSPAHRNKKVLTDADPAAIIIDNESLRSKELELPDNTLQQLEIGGLTIVLLQEGGRLTDMLEGLAFILYTSGSTGAPKGVMITHKNALTFINWASQTFSFSANDVFSSIAPLQFDLALFDVFVSLRHFASLKLYEQPVVQNPLMLASRLANDKVSVLYATPTLLCLLLNHGKLQKYDFSALRYVLFAGEVFPYEDLLRLQSLWDHVSFVNLYGPTETNVCTFFPLPAKIKKPVPIGRACINNTTKINGKAQEGELMVCGPGVTPGYWNNEALNQSKFYFDPSGTQWFLTGDIVRVIDGDYIYLGRNDRMVKRRGYRIELDEIERMVSSHSDILTSAIICNQVGGAVNRIKCYYQLKTGTPKLTQLELREFCLTRLPPYMLPDTFIALDNMPMTSTHKLDYQSLSNRNDD